METRSNVVRPHVSPILPRRAPCTQRRPSGDEVYLFARYAYAFYKVPGKGFLFSIIAGG